MAEDLRSLGRRHGRLDCPHPADKHAGAENHRSTAAAASPCVTTHFNACILQLCGQTQALRALPDQPESFTLPCDEAAVFTVQAIEPLGTLHKPEEYVHALFTTLDGSGGPRPRPLLATVEPFQARESRRGKLPGSMTACLKMRHITILSVLLSEAIHVCRSV